ncbi:MAG: NAD(P)H-quinone oxidoreductase, partial [Acidovorax sp.]
LARLQPGESVLIHAAGGGVGSAAVQLAHAAGAQVFATAGGDKHDAVRGFGADVVVDHRSEDFAAVVAEKTGGQGVDVVIDFIGAPYLERNVRSLAVGGRMVAVGLLGGAQGATLPMDAVLYRHLQIFGTVMKSRPPEVKQAMVQRFAQRWLPALADGTIRPVIDRTYPLAEAAKAHQRMESGASIGKILLLPGQADR